MIVHVIIIVALSTPTDVVCVSSAWWGRLLFLSVSEDTSHWQGNCFQCITPGITSWQGRGGEEGRGEKGGRAAQEETEDRSVRAKWELHVIHCEKYAS